MMKNLKNKDDDPVLELIERRQIKPEKVLEIGCSNAWRLNLIHKNIGAICYGIDPSQKAIDEGIGNNKNLILKQGTAEKIPFKGIKYDLIIFGFCLYLCDRKDLFKIVYEADKHLKDNGLIIIYDFEPNFPFKNFYKHKKDIFSYKMNYSDLFLANPSYFLLEKRIMTHYGLEKIDEPNERISVSLLMKNTTHDYIISPYE